jgi:hypothetical protein
MPTKTRPHDRLNRLLDVGSSRKWLALNVAGQNQYQRHPRQYKREYERPPGHQLCRGNSKHSEPDKKKRPTLP